MRWTPDARGRLEQAALELFAEQGYAATTVPQITGRAGLTTRTFFRHFADKREVIFGGNEIPENVARLIAAAPEDLGPMAVLRDVLHQVANDQFADGRAETAAWREMIRANDELRDRDARKRADMVNAARDAFLDRGQTPLQATVLAELGVLAFHVALDEWSSAEESRAMTTVVDEVLGSIAQHAGWQER